MRSNDVIARWLDKLLRLPGQAAILAVRLYQCTLSPLVGRQCRFHPTCSTYFIQAVEKYGLLSGMRRGMVRILRCQPWHPGGYDPP